MSFVEQPLIQNELATFRMDFVKTNKVLLIIILIQSQNVAQSYSCGKLQILSRH